MKNTYVRRIFHLFISDHLHNINATNMIKPHLFERSGIPINIHHIPIKLAELDIVGVSNVSNMFHIR